MGSRYAGVLGPLACLLMLIRGVLHGAGLDGTVWTAWLALLALAPVGFLIGQTAQWIVEDSVRSQIAQEATNQQVKANPT